MKHPLIFSLLVLLVAASACHPAAPGNRNGADSTGRDTLSDEALLDTVQRATFQYFWKGAEPNSGLAPERININGVYPQKDKDVVTIGGSGFGLMAILVGIKRGFITAQQGQARLQKILDFLSKADRFHGAWPHWLYGKTGKVKPFSPKDDGGDLVETSFLVQGLLCVREYFKGGDAAAQALAAAADSLWKTVDWQWYTHGQNVLYWHWSPDYAWQMNFPIHGYNECLITYVLAACSPAHGVDTAVYHEGWAENGAIKAPTEALGYRLQLRRQGNAAHGGPLFWAHYSYLGLSPKGLKDRYADYGLENTNQALINYSWCVKNPLDYKGYGPDSWGLTSSYSVKGYAGHAPSENRDLGVIAPTAAIASIPYTPEQSLRAIRHWYQSKKDSLWGPYGFYDAFSATDQWYPKKYLAIDQGPQVVMIENYRSGMLWELFMRCPEVQQGLKKLGFESPYFQGTTAPRGE